MPRCFWTCYLSSIAVALLWAYSSPKVQRLKRLWLNEGGMDGWHHRFGRSFRASHQGLFNLNKRSEGIIERNLVNRPTP